MICVANILIFCYNKPGDTMILYFSGTGNSAYVAKRVAQITGESLISINEYIKSCKIYSADKNEKFIFVIPTYAWRIPKIVEDWIKNIKQNGKHSAYFVMTCGGEIGNAEKYIRLLCRTLNVDFLGCAGIVMPENYIAMFDAPDEAEALRIIKKSEPEIDRIACMINDNKKMPANSASFIDKVYSSIVNCVFYPFIVHAKKFSVKDSCISCGKCEKLCPLNNICLKNGRPVWQDNCTHCMACICHCPASAIEYGNKSKNQPRYTCPK